MQLSILLIDDEDLVIRSLSRLFTKQGYRVISVTNADDALSQIKSSDFDLIVSDVRMPGKNGIEMVKEIRTFLESEGRKKIPEIFMTGYASDNIAAEAEKLKVAEYIYKPFDVKDFLELVKKHTKSCQE